jgi:hypothetical protein
VLFNVDCACLVFHPADSHPSFYAKTIPTVTLALVEIGRASACATKSTGGPLMVQDFMDIEYSAKGFTRSCGLTVSSNATAFARFF